MPETTTKPDDFDSKMRNAVVGLRAVVNSGDSLFQALTLAACNNEESKAKDEKTLKALFFHVENIKRQLTVLDLLLLGLVRVGTKDGQLSFWLTEAGKDRAKEIE